MLLNRFNEILGCENFASIELLDKGWSHDEKFIVKTKDGAQFLLKIADKRKFDSKETEFESMQKLSEMGIPLQVPIGFGNCDKGKSVYLLLTWIHGKDLELALLRLSKRKQYALGQESGRILKKIHTIPAPDNQTPWKEFFNRKTNKRIAVYHQCKEESLASGGEKHFLSYIEANRHLLNDRPQKFQHGDYHPGNMIISEEDSLSIIDWDRHDFGDPWEEFCRLVFTAHTSPDFAVGQLHGYFDGDPPQAFFELLAFYIASNALGVIGWSKPFGKSEVVFAQKQNVEILKWYDNMQEVVPSWYVTHARHSE